MHPTTKGYKKATTLRPAPAPQPDLFTPPVEDGYEYAHLYEKEIGKQCGAGEPGDDAGYVCSLTKGHAGNHVAMFHGGKMCCPPWEDQEPAIQSKCFDLVLADDHNTHLAAHMTFKATMTKPTLDEAIGHLIEDLYLPVLKKQLNTDFYGNVT